MELLAGTIFLSAEWRQVVLLQEAVDFSGVIENLTR